MNEFHPTVKQGLDVVHDIHGVIIRDRCAISRSNTLTAVHQHHGENGVVIIRLDRLAFFHNILTELIIAWLENTPRDRGQIGVDVTGRSTVFATHHTRTELAVWHQEVDVIRTDKILSHRYDGAIQRSLAMVVGGVL